MRSAGANLSCWSIDGWVGPKTTSACPINAHSREEKGQEKRRREKRGEERREEKREERRREKRGGGNAGAECVRVFEAERGADFLLWLCAGTRKAEMNRQPESACDCGKITTTPAENPHGLCHNNKNKTNKKERKKEKGKRLVGWGFFCFFFVLFGIYPSDH